MKVYATKNSDGSVGLPQVAPGDVVVLKASDSPFTWAWIEGIKGAADQPIVITAEGGLVGMKNGFALKDCQYIQIRPEVGCAVSFEINSGLNRDQAQNAAVDIFGRSAHIKVSGLMVKNAMNGIRIKNEPSCDDTLNNWVLDDIEIFNCSFSNFLNQGMYLGSTATNANGRLTIDCNGVAKKMYASRLGNIKIHDNYFENTGRAAIQLALAATGLSEIYNNTIRRSGINGDDQQGCGIITGAYTRAKIYNNSVSETFTYGIASFGTYVEIENNVIDKSGNIDGRGVSWAWPVVVDTDETNPTVLTKFIVRNNKTGSRGSGTTEDIFIGKRFPDYDKGNIISGNTNSSGPSIVKVFPGVDWSEGSVPPQPTKTIIKSSYWLIDGKRKYYTAYSDGSWTKGKGW